MVENKNSLLRPGDSFEKYMVEQELGHGGMGAVYLVRHRVLNTNFALKVLYPGVAQRDQQFVDRFIREAQLAGRIRHPNLIAVYDAGLNESNGMYYLVMDYVSGGSVRSKLRKQFNLSVMESLDIVRQIGHALEAALQHNMVHRDIKPDNIMFDGEGVARLADLGIAKATGDHDANLTIEAAVFGTPAYMSPEQAHDSRQVDIRADIYSLGIVLFEMLTGRRPFVGGSTIEILTQVISETPAPDVRTLKPEIPESVAKLVSDMIEKDLAKRIASPMELVSRVEAIINELKTDSEQVTQEPEAEVTMPTIMRGGVTPPPDPHAAEVTIETVSQPSPSMPSSAQTAEMTMETISQPSPSMPSSAQTAEMTMQTVSQPVPAGQKNGVTDIPQPEPVKPNKTVASSGIPTQKQPASKGGNGKIIMIAAGVIMIGLLLLAIGGGVFWFARDKISDFFTKGAGMIGEKPVVDDDEANKQKSTIENEAEPKTMPQKVADSELKKTLDEQKIHQSEQAKVETKPVQDDDWKAVRSEQAKVETKPVLDDDWKTVRAEQAKVETKSAQVQSEQLKVEPKPAQEEERKEVQSEKPKAKPKSALDVEQIPGKIVLFGTDNGLLDSLKDAFGEENVMFLKAGSSYSKDKTKMVNIQTWEPKLLLIAIGSCYDNVVETNFSLLLDELHQVLRKNGNNYAFVLESGTRATKMEDFIRRDSSVKFLDCRNGVPRRDDLKKWLSAQ